MRGTWIDREVLIAVKAYPNPSVKYHESVCVAGITREEGWIRLYPVRFRSLPANQRFQKWQRVRLRMKKHERDSRPESYRPDEDSFHLLDVLDSKHEWAKRRAWVEPTLSESMCEIQAHQRAEGMSLGAFRPRKVLDLVIEDGPTTWTPRQHAEMDQLMLFEERTGKLERVPFIFRYKYTCHHAACRGHTQSILDWEIMELYRNVRKHASRPDQIKSKIREKYLNQLCGSDRDTCFFVGNHSRYPSDFMVLGVFWPPRTGQRSLF